MQIRVENLSFGYAPQIEALRDISLAIQPGERVALVGRNGSGKTTLARHLNGLLQPAQGHIFIGDWRTDQHSVAQLASRVALLFQNPDDQIFKRQVEQEIAFGPKNLGYPPEKVNALVAQTLDWFELSAAREANPYDLGYSERKRVALASVVAMDTPILIFDEPTAGLDAGEIRGFAAALQNLSAAGKSVIVITHDLDFVAEQFPRVICLSEGQKRFDGAAQTAFGNPALLAEGGLLPPQIARLSAHFRQPNLALTPEEFLRNQEG